MLLQSYITLVSAFQLLNNQSLLINTHPHKQQQKQHFHHPLYYYASNTNLPSSYDITLPASLRGEAVRSALKSDRGVCLDFTSSTINPNLNIGLVKVTGTTISNFLNSKLSNSFPMKILNSKEKVGIGSNENVKLEYGQLKEAGLITSKGRLIDKLTVLYFNNEESNSLSDAYLMTSPGHSGSMLFDRLDPFIFPLDGVKLHDMCPTTHTTNKKSGNKSTKVFTVLATKSQNAQSTIQKNIVPVLSKWGFDSQFLFPQRNMDCLRYSFDAPGDNDGKIELLIHEQTFLPSCCCYGYTIIICQESNNVNDLASQIWNNMVDVNNYEGPVELGPLEYETLRIEAGVAAFRHEITGGLSNDDENDDEKNDNGQVKAANASPLELNLNHIVDETKGCYQGQEAIAAQLNNKRGAPRNLYNVIFPEEDNFFDGQNDEEEYSNHGQRLSNKTKLPTVGADLYVLGSNQEIKVGTLTSVAEKDGTASSETVALGLVRRSESILKRMKDMGLDITRDNLFEEDSFWSDGSSSSSLESGIINPPPLDPLDGLEVVVGDSFTQGYLRLVPSLRVKKGQSMFETDSWSPVDFQEETGSVMGFMPQNEITEEPQYIQKAPELEYRESAKNSDEEDALLEAQRKEEKMKLLQQRAEEALANRRKKKEAETKVSDSVKDEKTTDADAAAMEAARKEQKMKMLKERAEAAMKRRRESKQ